MAAAFDPASCLVLIAAWPDRYVAPEIFWWLERHEVRPSQVKVYCQQPIELAVNHAIRDSALASKYQHFIFIEHDIRPDHRTDPFVTTKADVVAGEYPIKACCPWRRPDDMHLGLWRTSRTVLERIKPPYVQREWTAGGFDEKKCPCLYLRDKFLAAGFKVVRAGRAGHVRQV